ncbi:hypothetical protein ACFY9X_34060 [Streptomyces nigra]|uniref:hypothetical protein n=1 Tax=Streptomyces nigra TaxID=1827580 RepID=UPI0036E25426
MRTMMWSDLSQPQAVLVAAAVGATGAIIGGAVASVLTQWLNGRAGRKRQWDETRHTAYARVTETFHAALGLYDNTGRLRADRAIQRRAADDLLAAYARAALLTRTDSTAIALEKLHDAAQELWDRPTQAWAEIDERCRRAEWTFRKEARAEMGLPTQHGIPQPPTTALATASVPPATAAVQAGNTGSSTPEPPAEPSA